MNPVGGAVLEAGQIFTLFFVTLGPLKVLGPFAQRTRGLDEGFLRGVAIRAFALATIGAIVGGFVGRSLAENWNVSLAAMTITAGVIFFLVALHQLMEQYEPPHDATPAPPLPASPMAAAMKILSPVVITPYGIATVIILLSASRDYARSEMIIGLLVIVMVLDLLAMLFARRIMAGMAVVAVLQLLGAVLAVLQVALAVQFVIEGLRGLGVLAR